MLSRIDPFDPNYIDFNRPHYISCGRLAEYRCLVDEEDYKYCIQFLWGVTHYKHQPQLIYPRRSVNRQWVYLHRLVMERAEIQPPSKKHIIVDHIDGNTLNCTKKNLRWATPAMNRHNINGLFYKQLQMNSGK